MNESRSLIRNSVRSSDSEWLAWRTSTLNMNTRSNGGRPPLGPVRTRHGTGEVVPEQFEINDAAQPLQRVALGREILQTLIDVEKTRLTAHHSTSQADDAITSRNPSNREVFGGAQSNAATT